MNVSSKTGDTDVCAAQIDTRSPAPIKLRSKTKNKNEKTIIIKMILHYRILLSSAFGQYKLQTRRQIALDHILLYTLILANIK